MSTGTAAWSEKQKSFLSSLSTDTSDDDGGLARPIIGVRPTAGTSRPSTTLRDDEDDDPDEIDISELESPPSKSSLPNESFSDPQAMMNRMMSTLPPQFGDRASSSNDGVTHDPFAEMMRQMGQQQQSTTGGSGGPMNPFAMIQEMQRNADKTQAPFPFPPPGGGGANGEMPDIFAMMEQMMTSTGASPGGPGGPGNPDAFGGMFGGGGLPGLGGMGMQTPTKTDPTARLWTLIHVASILLLLIFLDPSSIPFLPGSLTETTVFRGSGQPVFWYFITLQLILQSTRLFIYGPVLQNSLLTQIGGMLPPPYNGYATILARYSLIFTTIKDDFCLLIFGLGVRALIGR